MRVVFSCDSVPTYPPEVRYPRCAPPPRKAVLSVNGRSPDENGDVDLRKDFAGLLPGDDMTLSEVGSKVNEVVRKLNPGAEPGTGHGGPAEPYGPDTVLGDVRPSSTLKEISDAVPSFSPDGKLPVKALPKYLHEISFDDPYKDDAEAWYARLGSGAFGACSAVRRGGRLFRNYDWTFGFAAEFVVRMSAAAGRHASVGVASLGDDLTEDEAASGVYTSKFRALPGMTLDGINDAGVVAEINVDGGPSGGWQGTGPGSIHILAAVRWVLDHGDTAAQAAAYVATNVRRPQGGANFHFMIADATSTYIVENGVVHDVTSGEKVLTNYALYDASHAGGGKERYSALADGADITSVRFTNAYTAGNGWDSDFDSPGQHAAAILQWAAQGGDKEAHRGKTTSGGKSWWQTVHTAEYDFAAKTLKVAVQEQDEWFTFSVVESVPDDYASVRAAAAKGASHADETGNPHGTTASDVSFSEGVSVSSAIQSVSRAFGEHASDETVHVTERDRTAWDDKYTRQEVDDKITRFVAHYLTDKVDGRFVPFATHARLAEAKAQHTEENPRFFYAGEGFTPTKNDYCVVLSDETYGGKTTRYSFVGVWGEGGRWQYQYTINDTAFSAEQWAAINSRTSVDGDGNLCFDGIPIVDSDGKLIAGLTGEDIPVSSEDATRVADAIAAKRGLADFDVMGEVEVVPSGDPVEADFPSIKWYVTYAAFGDSTLEWSVSDGRWRTGDGLANIEFEEGQFKFYSVIGPATIGGYPQTPTWYETSYGNSFVLSVTKPAIGKVGSIARTSATSGVAKLSEDGVLTAATATDVPGLDKKRGLTDFDVAEAATGYVISNDIRDFECKFKVSETKWVESTDPYEYSQRGVVEFNSSGVGAHAYREYFDGTEWVHDIDFGTNSTAKPTDATFDTSGGDLESTVTAQLSAAQKLVRTSATDGIAKIGEDGVLVRATEGVDYLKTHQDISGKQNKITATGVLKGVGPGNVSKATPSSTDGESADYRDPIDSTCHKTVSVAGEWSKVTKDGAVWSVYRQDTEHRSEWILLCNGSYYDAHAPKDVGDDTATSLTWVSGSDWDKDYDITFTRTFTTVAMKDHTFVTDDNAHSKGVRDDGSPVDAELHDFFTGSNEALVKTIGDYAGGGGSQGYALVDLTPTSEGGYNVYVAHDHSINRFTLADATPVKVILPNATDANGRDFIVKVNVTSAEMPTFEIVKPSDAASVGIEAADDGWAELEAGINYFTFTETDRAS